MSLAFYKTWAYFVLFFPSQIKLCQVIISSALQVLNKCFGKTNKGVVTDKKVVVSEVNKCGKYCISHISLGDSEPFLKSVKSCNKD